MKLRRVFSKLFRKIFEKKSKEVIRTEEDISIKTHQDIDENISEIIDPDVSNKSAKTESPTLQEQIPPDQIDIDKPIKKKAITVKKAQLNIWVGIDFGTSSIKVAYRRMDATDKVFAVNFNHDLKTFPIYCIPSLIAFNENELLLGIDAGKYLQNQPWDSGVRRLKILAAGEASDSFIDRTTKIQCDNEINNFNQKYNEKWNIESLTTLLIAHTMHLAYKAIHDQLNNYELDVRFNVCVPIDYIEQNAVKSKYEKLVDIAFKLYEKSKNKGNIEFNSREISNWLQSWSQQTDSSTKRVFIIPESVAEIASYITSLEARSGIHTLIDFGAGTTDISIFNLLGTAETQYQPVWYAAKVIPIGSNRAEKIVANYIISNGQTACSECDVIDALKQLDSQPDNIKYKVRSYLESLWDKCCPVWGQAYSHLQSQSEWTKDKVKIFVSGGACHLPYVDNVFCESWMDKIHRQWGPYPIEVLPKPDNYDDAGINAPFERLSVAYGLTIPEPELGHFILPSDAPNHTPPKLPVREGKHNLGWTNY